MRQFNNLVSEIGRPSPINPVVVPLELEKGYQIDGWTVPFTMLAPSHDDLFRSFGLWQSSNGLCQSGVNHVSLNRWSQTANTIHPVLVGDQIDGQTVWRAVNSYNSNTRLWTVSIVWGVPPEPMQPEANDYAYLLALLKQVQTQADQTKAMLDDFFTKVLPALTVEGKTINNTSALLTWEPIKAHYEQKMNESIENMEDKQWQLF
jgi:hypothetical protein